MKEKECCEKKHCNKCASVDYLSEIADAFWNTCLWNRKCLEWLGTESANGYGVLTFKGRQWKAHRVAKALSGDFVPHWLVIDHLCRNTICVNPAHLDIVTSPENVMRGISFSAKNSQKTHCIKGHPYDIKNTKWTPSKKGKRRTKWRVCKTCFKLDRQRRSKELRDLRIKNEK